MKPKIKATIVVKFNHGATLIDPNGQRVPFASIDRLQAYLLRRGIIAEINHIHPEQGPLSGVAP